MSISRKRCAERAVPSHTMVAAWFSSRRRADSQRPPRLRFSMRRFIARCLCSRQLLMMAVRAMAQADMSVGVAKSRRQQSHAERWLLAACAFLADYIADSLGRRSARAGGFASRMPKVRHADAAAREACRLAAREFRLAPDDCRCSARRRRVVAGAPGHATSPRARTPTARRCRQHTLSLAAIQTSDLFTID